VLVSAISVSDGVKDAVAPTVRPARLRATSEASASFLRVCMEHLREMSGGYR
jgi:hypothetical protein